MLYTRTELKEMNTFEKCKIPLERYMHKFVCERNNIKRLKWHEKNFLFDNMRILRDDNNNKVFDIFSIKEAKDYAFNLLILIYATGKDGIIDFSKNVYDYDGYILDEERKRHKTLFEELMLDWSEQLNSGKGLYITILKPLFNRKWKEVNNLTENPIVISGKTTYMKAVFFHIMYKVRLYFDEKPQKEKYDKIVINNINVFADIYTYCHVLTRHYYPLMNSKVGGTLNENMPFVDVNNLPKSLLSLVVAYNKINPITIKTEYLLFEFQQVKYIMWLKYGQTNYCIENSLIVRSFYKCEEKRDLEKFSKQQILCL